VTRQLKSTEKQKGDAEDNRKELTVSTLACQGEENLKPQPQGKLSTHGDKRLEVLAAEETHCSSVWI
jgi:hypothetical protein